jgi:DNA-binding response OmpR family regulator
MKRRILLVDDDLAVLLTLKAVLELHGFDVDIANSTEEARTRLQSGIYQMVISDLRMETEDAGLEVLRLARQQSYDPATALLTAFPPPGNYGSDEEWSSNHSESLFIKPLGTKDLLRQVEALLIRHADRRAKKDESRNNVPKAQPSKRHVG